MIAGDDDGARGVLNVWNLKIGFKGGKSYLPQQWVDPDKVKTYLLIRFFPNKGSSYYSDFPVIITSKKLAQILGALLVVA
jgi:hypothetical protein